MKAFARITAIVLIITGILILFGGIALGITGTVRFLMNATPAARTLLRGVGPIGLIHTRGHFYRGIIRHCTRRRFIFTG